MFGAYIDMDVNICVCVWSLCTSSLVCIEGETQDTTLLCGLVTLCFFIRCDTAKHQKETWNSCHVIRVSSDAVLKHDRVITAVTFGSGLEVFQWQGQHWRCRRMSRSCTERFVANFETRDLKDALRRRWFGFG